MVDAHIRATYSYKGEQEGEVVRRLREEREREREREGEREEEKDILLLLQREKMAGLIRKKRTATRLVSC